MLISKRFGKKRTKRYFKKKTKKFLYGIFFRRVASRILATSGLNDLVKIIDYSISSTLLLSLKKFPTIDSVWNDWEFELTEISSLVQIRSDSLLKLEERDLASFGSRLGEKESSNSVEVFWQLLIILLIGLSSMDFSAFSSHIYSTKS